MPSTFKKLTIDHYNMAVVSSDATDPAVQGSVINDAISYANEIKKEICLHMAGKKLFIKPGADWYQVCKDFDR
jgi:hypothetical protein